VTTDADGEDCYRIVKSAGRFRIVRRTPGISTTDLVGRMLLCTKTHHIREEMGVVLMANSEMKAMMTNYASDQFGVLGNGPAVLEYRSAGDCAVLVPGVFPSRARSVVYVDGGFDLFTPGHVEFLRLVREAAPEGSYIVVGVHADKVINHWKGLNYPIMNQFERSMCVLQCRYVDSLVLSAPFVPDGEFLDTLEETYNGRVTAVYHGPTAFMPGEEDTYQVAKERGVFRQVQEHRWTDVNAGEIVGRILRERERYEERQRKKGVKAELEVDMVN